MSEDHVERDHRTILRCDVCEDFEGTPPEMCDHHWREHFIYPTPQSNVQYATAVEP